MPSRTTLSTPLHAGESLVLEMPAEAAYLTTARLFVGAAARHLGVDEETAQDIKLAISDAGTGAIGGQVIRLAVRVIGDRTWFELESDGSELGELDLVAGLFEDLTIEPTSAGGSIVRFSVPAD